jgi:hypothetical protein
MNEHQSTAGQGLGIAGLILGLFAIPLGLFPCTFFLAMVFGIVGIVLSAIALSQAGRSNGPKGLIIAALVCSVLGFSFALFWGVSKSTHLVRNVIHEIRKEGNIEEVLQDFGDEAESVLQDLEDEKQVEEESLINEDKTKALEDTLKALEGIEEK